MHSSNMNHIYEYMDHIIDFDNGKVIDSGNYRTRKTLES
jgi:energy-coupling factor transporter ATP-binding protein EcfA2